MMLSSSIVKKYPDYLSRSFRSHKAWLEGRRADDNAEGLWRVHDKLYDVSEFIKNHPGGSEWLEISKGLDITELFESHHISHKAEETLQKFYVRDAAQPRNSNLTFHPNGFYKTLKSRVAKELSNLSDDGLTNKSRIYCDLIFVCMIILFVHASRSFNLIIALITALFFAMLTNISHNFLHQHDNWRMYLLNFSFQSFHDWRVTHVFSHHVYTNSLYDLECSLNEPFTIFMVGEKSIFQIYFSWISSLIFPGFVYPKVGLFRFIALLQNIYQIRWDDFIPYSLPVLMYIFGNATLIETIIRWILIVFLGSFINNYTFIAGNHHHNKAFHDGDTLNSYDFGIFQVVSSIDRVESQKNSLAILTFYGEHVAHHLFPTLDHILLPKLRHIIEETCKEFGVEIMLYPWYELFAGHFKQIARTKPEIK